MPSGGARPGAGRKKGGHNRTTIEAQLRAAEQRGGKLPLEYMLEVMRDDQASQTRRDEMARAAAPYLHAKLANVQHSGDPDNPMQMVTRVERVIVDDQPRGDDRDGDDSAGPYTPDSDDEDIRTTH